MRLREVVVLMVLVMTGPAVCLAKADVLESYGDSLTAGMLSATSVTSGISLREFSQVCTDFANYALKPEMHFLTDHEDREKAWPTVLARLLANGRSPLLVRNAAISNVTSAQLSDEVNANGQGSSETLAFFFIGHNDVCHSSEEPEELARNFADAYNQALEIWDRNHQDGTAYLISVGQVQRVYTVLKGMVWHHGASHDFTCEDSWDLLRYCPTYGGLRRAGKLDAYLSSRIQAMNKRLQELAQDWNRKSTRNHFRFLRAGQEVKYLPEYFAVDCYHLSAEGQQVLAQDIYSNVINTLSE